MSIVMKEKLLGSCNGLKNDQALVQALHSRNHVESKQVRGMAFFLHKMSEASDLTSSC